MALGPDLKTKIDINYIRAQGDMSSGTIMFYPPRCVLDGALLSQVPVPAKIEEGVGSVELVRLPVGQLYSVRELIDGRPPFDFQFALPEDAPAHLRYEAIAPVTAVPATYTAVRTVNGIAPDPTTGNVELP